MFVPLATPLAAPHLYTDYPKCPGQGAVAPAFFADPFQDPALQEMISAAFVGLQYAPVPQEPAKKPQPSQISHSNSNLTQIPENTQLFPSFNKSPPVTDSSLPFDASFDE